MLELELNHLYRDIHSVFKSHRFKIQEELNVDNFKDNLNKFVSHILDKTNKGFSSFEDIKEQENDDSMIDKERSNKMLGSGMVLT